MASDTQLFRNLFDASPIGIVVENLDGQPLFVNAAFCSFLGFTEEELCSKHCVDFSPAEDVQKDWALFQQLRAGVIDRYQLEKRYFRKDGSLVWGRLSLSLLRNDPTPLVVAMVEDITEKKSAEEFRFRHIAAIESSQDAIISNDLDAVITSWNEGAQRLFGYTEAEAVGQPITILSPRELRDEETQILEKLKAEGRIEDFETTRITKSGRNFDVSLTISPIKDSSGNVVGFSYIARDTTQRKKAEKIIRESQDRYRRIIETANEGVWLLDSQFRTTYVNRQMEKMLGCERGEMMGRSVFDFYFPQDVEHKREILSRRQKGLPEQLEERFQRKDGSELWTLMSATPVFNENRDFDGALAMVSDITERRQAEDALRESEQKFRSVFREAGVGMVIVSPEGRYLAANRTFCAYVGYTEQELLKKNVESITFPEDWPAFSQGLREALEKDRGFQWLQKRCLHKSGRIVYTESSTSLIRSREGNPQYFIAHVLDITQRKKAEEALSGMTRRLIEAQEQERARIARELHDDVSQQLALLAVELDQWDQGGSHDADFRDHIQRARRRIVEIGQDVQSLSHQLHSSKLEYLGLVAAARGFSREISEKAGVRVEFREDGIPQTLSNEASIALFRILQQALRNAVDHSGAKRVEIRLWEQFNEVHLTVKDPGKGFDLSAAMQGTGLGLTSMRERARLVDGEVAIDSKPMGGTTIHARVPLHSEAYGEKQAV
jgi:PAS domain S-box-containing protein